jgi:4-diphosphocytidyl-2-C-methyl-D-erythritol kinase
VGFVMREVRLRAFAKVNFALDVIGLRVDGYHDIASVMQSISLSDEVEIERITEGFEFDSKPEAAEIGPPERNTAYVAWKSLQRLTGGALPASVRLRKWIPVGAGLGGGSADAAAVLVGLNELFGLGLRVDELREVGARVGADVPFCISGGTALAEGVGEMLTPLPGPPAQHLVLAKPHRSADTGEIYRAHDAAGTASARRVDPVILALQSGSLRDLASAVGNDLTSVTSDLVPDVAVLQRKLLAREALAAAMSGSGTAVYGIFDDKGAAERAADTVDAPFTGVYEPVPHGVEIV